MNCLKVWIIHVSEIWEYFTFVTESTVKKEGFAPNFLKRHFKSGLLECTVELVKLFDEIALRRTTICSRSRKGFIDTDNVRKIWREKQVISRNGQNGFVYKSTKISQTFKDLIAYDLYDANKFQACSK